jgi:transcriptional regulator with PAS, ATPase and Fis domain
MPKAQIDDVLSHCRSDSPDCRIAVIGVVDRPLADATVLDDIRRLKAEDWTVLCYADGASTWPLGVQCRLLLAGASHLLDSSAAGFGRELRDRVDRLHEAALESARETEQVKLEMRRLGVIGSSRAITSVFRWIVGASAVSDLPVLLVGETGTGKELAARAVHRLDVRRRDRPFIPVNCGAISAGLSEAELFGHRHGAFTGADHDRVGLVRAARGGVLFLDEIADLELSLQAKLLRVLQERRVLAVGDDHEVPVDVRVIAATNRELADMVQKREFRADLFHRLNVLSIRLPALRDRPEDIEPLVQHFLDRSIDRSRDGEVTASREFVDALRRVELPGNVRQLENVVHYAVVSARRGEPLRLNHLPRELWLELSRGDSIAVGLDAARVLRATDRSSPLDPAAILDAASWKLERAMDACEQHLLAAALGASSGNRSRAAQLLGISPRAIFNKMRKYRLSA